MIAVTLSTELASVAATGRPGRATQLSTYVDRWCEIDADASSVFAVFAASGGGAPACPQGGSDGVSGRVVSSDTPAEVWFATPGVVVSTSATSTPTEAASTAEQCEVLLDQVGLLGHTMSHAHTPHTVSHASQTCGAALDCPVSRNLPPPSHAFSRLLTPSHAFPHIPTSSPTVFAGGAARGCPLAA